MVSRRALAGLATLVALVTALAVASLPTGGAARPAATANLLLDSVRFRPELAVDSEQRSRGLMHRLKAPKDGMLFVFPEDTRGAFWMKNTLVPLAIVFFDSQGRQVRRLRMTPCRRDPCPVYEPRRAYRFALELRASDSRPAKRLGPLAAIRRLSRSAT